MQRPSAGRNWNLFKGREQVCVAELGGGVVVSTEQGEATEVGIGQ